MHAPSRTNGGLSLLIGDINVFWVFTFVLCGVAHRGHGIVLPIVETAVVVAVTYVV